MMIKNSPISLDIPIKNSLKFNEIALTRRNKEAAKPDEKQKSTNCVIDTLKSAPRFASRISDETIIELFTLKLSFTFEMIIS